MRSIGIIVGLVTLLAAATCAQDSGRASPSHIRATLSRLPICFVENRGVYPDAVSYSVRGADKTLFFTRDGLTFRLRGPGLDWVVKLEFVGADPDVAPRGEDRQSGVFSYFRGPEKNWKTGLGTYARLIYEDLWPGIDLVYRGGVNRLKYEFVVKPGADPKRIRLRYRGAERVTLTGGGALRVATPAGRFEDAAPVAGQEIDGGKVEVRTRYALDEAEADGGRGFGFEVGPYDATRPLVLDPVLLVYCGFIGGADGEDGRSIAVDAAGCAYVTGHTWSNEQTFPVRVGPDLTFNGVSDAYVAKVNAAGTGLVYCGYIGGNGDVWAHGIAVDGAGNACVTGVTFATQATFPVKVGPDLTHNGGAINFPADAFVAKVNAAGTGLVYCGYIGGSGDDWGTDIAVDAAGNAYVTGTTKSAAQTFPVKAGPDLTYNGVVDVFVAKVNAAGTGLVYCGYIGGSGNDYGTGIAVDAAGNAHVIGNTTSTAQTFPVSMGPSVIHNGLIDAFVAKVNAKGTALAWCGYLGGSFDEYGMAIAVDAAGNAYVTGATLSDQTTFPVRVGPDRT